MKKLFWILALLISGCAQNALSVDAFTVTPSVDVTGGPAVVTGTATITSISPVRMGMTIAAPNQQYTKDCTDVTPVGNVWECSITIPQGVYPGDWKVVDVWAEVGVDRYHQYTGSLESNGFPATISVTSPSPDTLPPNITFMTALQERVPGGMGYCSFSGNDDSSGINRIGCTFENPSQNATWSCSGPYPLCSEVIPVGAEAGTWTEISRFAIDEMENRTVEYDGVETFEVETPGLILHYEFDAPCTGGFTTDSTANGNDGTCLNSPTHVPGDGKPNPGAMEFSAANDAILVTAAELARTRNITMAAWVKPAIAEADGATIMGGLNSALRKNGANPEIEHYTISDTLVSNIDIFDGAWHHIVLTFDGSLQTPIYRSLYLDGVPVSDEPPPITATTTLVVGDNQSLNAGWTGSIDDVRVYNYALDAGEVAALYALGAFAGLGPDPADFDNVIEITGTDTAANVVSTINSFPPGETVLVQGLGGRFQVDSMTGDFFMPRDGVTVYGLNTENLYVVAGSNVYHNWTWWGNRSDPGQFEIDFADGWTIRDSYWSGGEGNGYDGAPVLECIGNVYRWNRLAGSDTDNLENWSIVDNVFENFASTPDDPGLCGENFHSEALFINATDGSNTLSGNVFTNNGNTSSLFLSWGGIGVCESSGGLVPGCYPKGICIENNVWNATWDAWPDLDINCRSELTNLNTYLDPSSGAWAEDTNCAGITETACPTGAGGAGGAGGVGGSPPAGGPDPLAFDNVIEITGTDTSANVIATINGFTPGESVLVRGLGGRYQQDSMTGTFTVPRDNVTVYGLLTENLFTPESPVRNNFTWWGNRSDPGQFLINNSDNWTIRDSFWSGGVGGGYDGAPIAECAGNIYRWNAVWGSETDNTQNWSIVNNTIQNFASPETDAVCGDEHSEGIFINASDGSNLISGNTFANNGNTAQIFLSTFGNDNCTPGVVDPNCDPKGICIENNTWLLPWDTFDDLDIQCHSAVGTTGTYVDPTQSAYVLLCDSGRVTETACPVTATGSISVDISGLDPACTGAYWVITGPDPGSPFSGTGNFGPTTVSDGTYTITWNPTAFACSTPDFGGGSNTQQKVVASDAQTFDLAGPEYTPRTVRQLEVQASENGAAVSTITAAWSIQAAPPFSATDAAATGADDAAVVSFATGAVYDGRDYEITWTPESGFTTPPGSTVTAQATKQVFSGNYVPGATGIDQTGLIAFYDFETADGGALADKGAVTSNDLTLGTTPTSPVLVSTVAAGARIEGQGAFVFTGGSYLQASDTPFDATNSDLTIAAWVRTVGAQPTWGYICGKGEGAYGLEKGVSTGTGEYGFSSTAGSYSESSLQITENNVWHHVAATWDESAGTTTIYVDGVATVESPITMSSTVGETSTQFEIGRNNGYWTASEGFFEGSIDDVAIFSRILTPGEIVTLKDTGLGECVPDTTCNGGAYVCGNPLDGCGQTQDCTSPGCTGGDVCFPEGTCCTPYTCVPNDCGTLFNDGCGGIVDCDAALGLCNTRSGDGFSVNAVCDTTSGQCCEPSSTVCTDPDPDYECGDWPDGCGGTVNCDTGGLTCAQRVSGEFCTGLGQCQPGETVASGCTLGTPYCYPTQADVGTVVGVGITAPVPTTVYTGPGNGYSNPLLTSDTTIENVIINDCLQIGHPDGGGPIVSNITIRNVIITCNTTEDYGVHIQSVTNLLVEYSQITNNFDGKVFAAEDCENCLYQYNDLRGGQDVFFFWDNNEEVTAQYNVYRDPVGNLTSHADGVQMVPDINNTNIYIRGNHFDYSDQQATVTPNDVLQSGDFPTSTILMENNWLSIWGLYTFRVYSYSNNWLIQNNVYEQQYKTDLAQGINGIEPDLALYYEPQDGLAAPPGAYRCNRYEDGTFIEQAYVQGDGVADPIHDTTGCPAYPP